MLSRDKQDWIGIQFVNMPDLPNQKEMIDVLKITPRFVDIAIARGEGLKFPLRSGCERSIVLRFSEYAVEGEKRYTRYEYLAGNEYDLFTSPNNSGHQRKQTRYFEWLAGWCDHLRDLIYNNQT